MKDNNNYTDTNKYSVIEYNKLVKDKIPEMIIFENRIPITHIADLTEYTKMLNLKLQEEVNEYFEDNNIEELADIIEVIYAILDNSNYSREDLEKIRLKKFKERGGFKNRIILDKIYENRNC